MAHAGVYTLAGYLAWSLVRQGVPDIVSLLLVMAASATVGAAIQYFLYAEPERRRATHLVVLIASPGTLAAMQNVIAAVYTPNILQFPLPWGSRMASFAGIRLRP